MYRSIRLAAILTVFGFCGSATHADAAWTPPIGIPAPAFGINESAPAAPASWTVATPGFYYVNPSGAGATDTSNPYGTPARPRRTVPTTLPAGAVVEIHGTYPYGHTIVANGTAAAPVFIRGASSTTKPIIQAAWEVSGTYVILENLEFGPLDSTQTGSLTFSAPVNFAALRGSDLHGNLQDGGLGVVAYSTTLTQNVVVYNNTIHDNGDVNATYDQDIHGIVVNGEVSNLWVVDNTLARNSGDGIQISAGSAALQAALHHVYVGRNTAYNNKQTGFWAKQATDVIFSQNTCHSHRPSNSSMGQCMGFQYATQRVWFLFNTIYDSDYGIAVTADSTSEGNGTGTDSYFIGNVIHAIHTSTGSANSGSGWGTSGIMLAGGINRKVINNTIYDVDAGVNAPEPGTGTLEIADNIIGQVTIAAGNHVFVEDPALAVNTSVHHNLLEGDARIRMGGSQVHLTQAQLAAMLSTNASAQFINAAGANYHLQSTSPAIDAGETNGVYATFQQRYGISIQRDADGTARPGGTAMDLGAYESGGSSTCGTSTPPPAPTNLRVAVTGTTATFIWTEPATTCNAPANFWIEAGSAPGTADLGSASTGNLLTTIVANNVAPSSFYVRVKAQNAAGLSAASNEVLTVIGVPGPVTGLTATVSGRTMTFSWAAPTIGAAPSNYVLEAGLASGQTAASSTLPTGTATTFVATNVNPGTYYIRIRAKNALGVGLPSNEIKVVVQ